MRGGGRGITPVKITQNTFNLITFVEDLFDLCDKNIRCCSFIINLCYKLRYSYLSVFNSINNPDSAVLKQAVFSLFIALLMNCTFNTNY